MDFSSGKLEQALEVLGERLLDSQQYFEVVAIGGASLLLLGQIDRTTRDIDLVALIEKGALISANPLPLKLQIAVDEVGITLDLGKKWFNAEPTTLLEFGLPIGFRERLSCRDYGGLKIYFANRYDQIHFKLYATVDQGPYSKHFDDLKRLSPSAEELQIAGKWCCTQDVSQPFADELKKALEALGVVDGA